MPSRFALLILVTYDLFLTRGVDVLIVEVGIGGEYDATNIIRAPVVCGIASIHHDHIHTLGRSLVAIAWHKSGIFKVEWPP